MWNRDRLFTAPAIWPVEDSALPALDTEAGKITPIFFEGPPFGGNPTRVFAWLGIPAAAGKNASVPGIVLVHGGGGTAFRDWVLLWVKRGYAAIAMDTGGNIPLSASGMTVKSRRHEWPGPPDTQNILKASEPVGEQGAFHVIAAIIRAHNLLRAQPGTDAARTGITGISWGGVWTEVVVGLDSRFKFAAPVYGCAFKGENSPSLEGGFQRLPPALVTRWLELWEPSQYLPFAKMPILFVNGTNDHHFRPDVWQKTTLLPGGPVTRSLKVRMPHGHPPAGDPKEITVFADSIVKTGTPPLARVIERGRNESTAWITWETAASTPITSVEFVFTTDTGHWPKRNWTSVLARTTPGKQRAENKIPDTATAFYFNLHDSRGCTVSSELREADANALQ
jgi:dienelactone hydrolase